MALVRASKKFALFACCLMTMQALRLVISTAGFCVVRFHIDPELFNIFISRLVNAVMMSQLFGNWLGDLIVFGAGGQLKLISVALANWAELICFCSALFCICHTECGHLTGFYWSMVCAYFWWKVGEAPCGSVGVPDNDWYFAGFTLSGVWSACLKGVVMMCIQEEKGIHSDALGDVNVTVVGDVSVVGTRSVKTTVDYRAARTLFTVTIVITFMMCTLWDIIATSVTTDGRNWVLKLLCNAADTGDASGTDKSNNMLVSAIKKVTNKKVDTKGTSGTAKEAELGFNGANLETAKITKKDNSDNQITITVAGVEKTSGDGNDGIDSSEGKTNTKAVQDDLKKQLEELIGTDTISGVTLSGEVPSGKTGSVTDFKITVTANSAGRIVDRTGVDTVGLWTGVVMTAIMAVPGALLFGWLFGRRKWCAALGAVAAALAMKGIFGGIGASANDVEEWVVWFKWSGPDYKKDDVSGETDPDKVATVWAALIGLGVGLATGALTGLCIGAMVGAAKGQVKRKLLSGLAAGAFYGSFLGLWSGEIYNGYMTWTSTGFLHVEGGQDKRDKAVVVCGFLIVVLGLGTVYSIYPGMAPCSITQFKYFNIIDILILILSAIAPIVIMGVDLAEADWRLVATIRWNKATDADDVIRMGRMWGAVGSALVMLLATIICEIIVIHIMNHPEGNLANKVTTSGWRAVLLTVMMVTCQLTSTGIGFGCVAAGGGFNDGVNNALSTVTLWTVESCALLGEGYLTELKKYEPGKWPTQGMGKWASYWWWNGKAFGNASQIWCCIGTTDLRRDIMLCKK